MFAASTILYKMIVCLSESRGGSSFGESIFSYCGQRYWLDSIKEQIDNSSPSRLICVSWLESSNFSCWTWESSRWNWLFESNRIQVNDSTHYNTGLYLENDIKKQPKYRCLQLRWTVADKNIAYLCENLQCLWRTLDRFYKSDQPITFNRLQADYMIITNIEVSR
jgi:hypothetical protein